MQEWTMQTQPVKCKTDGTSARFEAESSASVGVWTDRRRAGVA